MNSSGPRAVRQVPGRYEACIGVAPWRLPIALLMMLTSAFWGVPLNAQVAPEASEGEVGEVVGTPVASFQPRERYALIVVGIPGDEIRIQRFGSVVDSLRKWLVEKADVSPDHIVVVTAESELRSDAETLRQVTADLSRRLGEEDALWVFSIGHGSVDKRAGWFHLPGPDLNDTQWANLFSEVRAKEQVYWFTHSGSGRFIKSFSRPGRIVITATDPEEVNETRFPGVLAEVLDASVSGANETEGTDDVVATNRMSVLELFRSVCNGVDVQYQSENLVPTEHAQLDDNGDGLGTEVLDLNTEVETIDGGLADRVIVKLRRPPKHTSDQSEVPPLDSPEGEPAP